MSCRLVVVLSLLLLPAAQSRAQSSGASVATALKNGDRAAARRLIEQRADVNAALLDGSTPLHFAAERDDAEFASLLIREGANVNAVNRFGVPPLLVACSTGSAATIEVLVKAGADPNSALPEGETALMAAARAGRLAPVKLLLASGANANAREAWRSQTALMWAASEGHAEVISELAGAGADLAARAVGGFTPLLFAVRGGHVDAVRVLLAAGAGINDPGSDGTSALSLAIINAHFELAALLLDGGADPNAADPRGSALHAVTWMRNTGYTAAPPRVPTGTLDSLDLARALLKRGANPNARIAWKEVPFDRDRGTVKSPPSISIGRNWLSFVGATPFFLAAKGADLPLMRLLVDAGADPLLPTVQNVTPLMVAAGLGFWDGESPGPESGVSEAQALEAIKLTIEAGNDLNAVTDYGNTVIEGDSQVLLRRHPLNLSDFDERALGDMRWGGSTALHGAALRGANSIVKYLVDRGARVDAPNKLGWTPLTVASGVFVANTEKRWPSTIALLDDLRRTANEGAPR